MGFVVLFAVGIVLGWTASIITRTDDPRGILSCVASGLAGALVGGILASSESLLIGVSATALLAAIAAAIGALVALHFARLRMVR